MVAQRSPIDRDAPTGTDTWVGAIAAGPGDSQTLALGVPRSLAG
jgi:hypothetical protein